MVPTRLFPPPGAPPAAQPDTRARVAGWAAFAWLVEFIGLHVNWFLGGHLLRDARQQTYPVPTTAVDYAYAAVVAGMYAVGLLLPLLTVTRWGRRVPGRLVRAGILLGATVLALRGGAGMLDLAGRVSGVLPLGLTGGTYEEITGVAHPSAGMLWKDFAIELHFVLGAVLFGWLHRATCGRA